MAWNLFTVADVDGISEAEIRGVSNFNDAKDQLPGVVDDMVRAVRGAIATRQPVGPEGTVPDSLRHYVSHLAVYHFLLTLPGALMTDARKEAAESAERIMDQLRKGEIRCETPTTASTEEINRQTIGSVTANTRNFTADKLAGL